MMYRTPHRESRGSEMEASTSNSNTEPLLKMWVLVTASISHKPGYGPTKPVLYFQNSLPSAATFQHEHHKHRVGLWPRNFSHWSSTRLELAGGQVQTGQPTARGQKFMAARSFSAPCLEFKMTWHLPTHISSAPRDWCVRFGSSIRGTEDKSVR